MEEQYVPGQWYRSGSLIFCVEPTGRVRQSRTGEFVPEVRNRVTISVVGDGDADSEARAVALLGVLQAGAVLGAR